MGFPDLPPHGKRNRRLWRTRHALERRAFYRYMTLVWGMRPLVPEARDAQ